MQKLRIPIKLPLGALSRALDLVAKTSEIIWFCCHRRKENEMAEVCACVFVFRERFLCYTGIKLNE